MSLPVDYFDALYAKSPDPWGFETSPYERTKYAATLAALPRPRYGRALEVGCAIGVLTALLAPRCEALLALDGAEAALALARRRVAALPQVRIRRAWVPGDWPQADGTQADGTQADGPFDLILLSEVIYYLQPAEVADLARRVRDTAAPGADILAVHWTGETDYPMSGDAAAEAFIAALGPQARILRQDRQPEYRLDLMRL
ncbi:SAM-dependent methyltransferase [Falsiroseomonas sp. E2-1-a20]|uniref:SAM-dependent methyltransferase n=1 Tax=Falsiroseomonas sp. E2-1-a20 TaxID=3239300 RepID=UPI003F2A49E6